MFAVYPFDGFRIVLGYVLLHARVFRSSSIVVIQWKLDMLIVHQCPVYKSSEPVVACQ